MESNISRQQQLSLLETYLKDVNMEVTMILQSLQWDRKHLLEKSNMCVCQYNSDHRVPPDKLLEHETGCWLKSQGYTEEDRLLPSPMDPDSNTLVKLNADDIQEIINTASGCQASFKKGSGCSGNQPLTLERLQATYTADERRAIHDAVVSRVPSCHDLSDLALLSSMKDEGKTKPKSKMEILAELRDMKRRRTKYRVAAKSQNYSDVLRDVINTQMELYTQAQDKVGQLKEEKPGDTEDNKSKKDSPTRRRDNSASRRNISCKEHSSSLQKDSSRRYKEHDNRKRSREYNHDAYISPKYSKSNAGDRSKSYRDKDKHYRYDHARSNNSRTERRNDRHKRYSSRSREGSYDDYERRKTRREEDRDYRKKTDSGYTKTVPPPKIIKEEESDKTENSDNQSTLYTKSVPPPKIIKKEENTKIETSENETVSSEKYCESKEKPSFEGSSLNNHSDRQNNSRYESTNEGRDSNDSINRKIYPDGYKQENNKDTKVKQENDDSYSSKDETAHTEDGSRYSGTYNKHRTSDDNYQSQYNSDKYKMKYRHNETNKNRDRNYGSDLRRDIKIEKDIKQEPLDSNEDRKDDKTYASDRYHDNRRKDKSYSRSYKEKINKHKDRYENRKGRYEHSNTKYGSYEGRH